MKFVHKLDCLECILSKEEVFSLSHLILLESSSVDCENFEVHLMEF